MPAREPDRFRRGVEHLAARRFLKARRELAAAVAEGGPGSLSAVQELVQTFLRRGEGDRVEAFLRGALSEDSPVLHHGLGYWHRFSGRIAEAAAAFERAASVEPRRWQSVGELGWVRCLQGKDREGLKLLRRAERELSRRRNAWGRATMLTHQATWATMQSRFGPARALLAKAIAAKRECGDPLGLATVLYNLGYVEVLCCEHVAALRHLEEALEIQRRIGFQVGKRYSLNLLGHCHLELGFLERAEACYREVLESCRRSPDPARMVAARHNLGQVAHLRDETKLALRQYGLALAVGRYPGDSDDRAMGLSNMAEIHLDAGRPGVARELLAEAPEDLQVRTRLQLSAQESRALLASGHAAQAAAVARRALDAAMELPGPQRRLLVQVAAARVALGRASVQDGDVAGASRQLRAAHQAVEELLATHDSRRHRIGLFAIFRQVSDGLVACELARGSRSARRAFQVARLSKARELRETLAAADQASPRAPSWRVEARQLAELPRLGAVEARRLREARTRLVTGRAAAGGRLRSGSAEDVGRALGRRAALVEYHVGDETTHAFVVQAGHVAAVDLGLPRARLTGLVDRLVAPFVKNPGAGAPDLDSFEAAAAYRLFRLVVAPALERLTGTIDELVIVPDGPLHRLPFELLVLSGPHRSSGGPPGSLLPAVRYLSDEFVLSRAPTSHLVPDVGVVRTHVVVISHSPTRQVNVDLAGRSLLLAPIDGATKEARAVAAAHHGAAWLAGAQATPAAMLRAGRGAAVLHVAAHGFADPIAPERSGLLLAGDRGEPRVVTAGEIARSRIPARLVVLSACESGAGRTTGREGPFSLARAFFEAGSRAVLSSLWRTDDEASVVLMTELHDRLAAGEIPRRAVAAARRRLRHASGEAAVWSHPFHWAGFTLAELRSARGGPD